MALNGCSNGLLVTAAVALLLLPAQYYVPDFYVIVEDQLTSQEQSESSQNFGLFDLSFLHLPPLDLFVTVTILVLGVTTYLFEWIQRKVMEKRIVKLNQYLGESLERLRAWDSQQQQQEATLKMVQNATSEYNLLLYLLLRQHRYLTSQHAPSTCFYEKDLDEVNFLKNPPHEV